MGTIPLRSNTVVLGLPSVDRFHVESMTEDEGDLFLQAEISQPVPGEDAFGGNDDVITIGSDDREERIRIRREVFVDDGFSCAGEDADIHGPGMKVDPAVVLMFTVVESHEASFFDWVALRHLANAKIACQGGGLNKYHGVEG
jgi:hypothetical protein